jgi:diadenosine tetraphosphate (Ap4A) HIT family hydrolase
VTRTLVTTSFITLRCTSAETVAGRSAVPGAFRSIRCVTDSEYCFACAEGARDSGPRWQRVASDEHWQVSHATNTALPGWLVLVPRRHVEIIAELTGPEAASLASWQVRVSRALHAVTGCTKTYIAQFAEAEGFGHVHFHIVLRMADLPANLRGPRVFGLLGPAGDASASEEEMNRLAELLSKHLAAERL